MKRYLIGCILGLAVIAAGVLALNHHADPPISKSNTPSKGSYVALGDSVAAGIGLQPYSDPSACNRTNASYPYVTARNLHLTLTNLACSGATIPSGITGSQTVNQLALTPQLNQLFSQPRPRVISLTIGANDVQWTQFLAKCYQGTCGTSDDSDSIASLMDSLTANLNSVMTQLQQHYGTSVPPVVVTGYYQVIPAQAATCSDLQGVDPHEQAWIRQQFVSLNSTIKMAVSGFGFAHFTGADFSGHELCSSNPWVQGLQDGAPYHPTSAGQSSIAAQVTQAMKTTTKDSNL